MAWCGVLGRVALIRGSLKNGLVWSLDRESLSIREVYKEWLGVEFWTESLSLSGEALKEWLGVEFWESSSLSQIRKSKRMAWGKSQEWLGSTHSGSFGPESPPPPLTFRGSLKKKFAWCGVLDRVSSPHQGKSFKRTACLVEFRGPVSTLSIRGSSKRMAWCGVLDRVSLTRGSPKNGLVWSFGPSRSLSGEVCKRNVSVEFEWAEYSLNNVEVLKEWLGVEFWTESLSSH
ncbi:hypothetical protein RRG08_000062 [Elysia crispata]|uniref:Uncharacterized protein n=1 Tax=Elysia crispata TaxID=231223 RepID=A0AAE1CJE8_9GAST|nr:hypothetical protein RRG08_000062 [Elysia crispata]